MNEMIKRLMSQIKDVDTDMQAKQLEVEQHHASINKLAPEFNTCVREKTRLITLLLNEIKAELEKSEIKLV